FIRFDALIGQFAEAGVDAVNGFAAAKQVFETAPRALDPFLRRCAQPNLLHLTGEDALRIIESETRAIEFENYRHGNRIPLRQSFAYVLLDPVQVLNSPREPDEAVADSLPFSFSRADVTVRSRGRMAEGGGGVAQRRAEGDGGGEAEEAVDGIAAAGQLKAE